MATTSLQLRFRVWGRDLDPDAMSAATGVVPTRSFRIGEKPSHMKAAHGVAGWEWWSEWGDFDLAPLLSRMMAVLRPSEAVFRGAVTAGAEISLSVVGYILGDAVQTEAEAGRVHAYGGEGRAFRPFLVTDSPCMDFDLPVLTFLTAISASLLFHLDADLDSDLALPSVPE